MRSYVALYRGQTIASSELVAVTADPEIVRAVARSLLAHPDPISDNAGDDPVRAPLTNGRRLALRAVAQECA